MNRRGVDSRAVWAAALVSSGAAVATLFFEPAARGDLLTLNVGLVLWAVTYVLLDFFHGAWKDGME